MINYSWFILAIPLLSFLVIGFGIRPYSGKGAAWVGTTFIFGTFLTALSLAWSYFSAHALVDSGGSGATSLGETALYLIPWSFEWLRFQPGLIVHMGFLLDSISSLMIVVVTSISLLVHIYSLAYMDDDPGIGRFFTYLSLFTFSMLGLVIAPNIFQMYVFWELVGVSSFLLIGFYYQKPAAVAASKKAFIVTRFADLGFLVGILLLGYLGLQVQQTLAQPELSQALDFSFLTNPQVLEKLTSTGLLGLALSLIYMGAAGKSAMFPLHIWLPDAMEGPTPVSALIHAATMVVAGVYLVARMFPAFSAVPSVLEMVSWVGLGTSAFAAIIACTQEDIKRVLAFSTLSQLGYMMFSLGISSMNHSLGYTASLFHLFTHAFFKALLFLGAGAIIHAVHTNNVWEMGGLRKKMPVTHATFLIAVLAISGIWPFAGFFSKDEILTSALETGHSVHFWGGLLIAGLTAFYMTRIYILAFWGESRKPAHKVHEAPLLMLLPLLILATLSIVAGWLPFGQFVHIGAELEHQGLNQTVVSLGSFMAFLGITSAWYFCGQEGFMRIQSFTTHFQGLYKVIHKKFYFDEIYLFITHQIIFRFVAAPISWFDRNIVDGAVNLTGSSTQRSSSLVTRIQTGQVQTYGVWFILSTVFILIIFGITYI